MVDKALTSIQIQLLFLPGSWASVLRHHKPVSSLQNERVEDF